MTCDYMDCCNIECNTNRYLQLTTPLPRKIQNQAKLSSYKNRGENRPHRQVACKCTTTQGDLNLSHIMLLAWALYSYALSSQKTGQNQAILFEMFTIMLNIVP